MSFTATEFENGSVRGQLRQVTAEYSIAESGTGDLPRVRRSIKPVEIRRCPHGPETSPQPLTVQQYCSLISPANQQAAFGRLFPFGVFMTDLAALKAANEARWARAKVVRWPAFAAVAKRLVGLEGRARYGSVAARTGVPWPVIAVIHERECSQDWAGSLAQGDPWDKISVHVPAGRGPFKSWEEAAVDALVHCAPYAARNKDWSIGRRQTLSLCLVWNGSISVRQIRARRRLRCRRRGQPARLRRSAARDGCARPEYRISRQDALGRRAPTGASSASGGHAKAIPAFHHEPVERLDRRVHRKSHRSRLQKEMNHVDCC